MKKFLCLLLSLVMVLCMFTACGDDKKTDGAAESDVVTNTEKDVNIFTDELVIADKLSSAIDDAKNGSVATIKMGISLLFDFDITEGDAEILKVLQDFGCTANKIDLNGEISLLTTADDKGKVKFSIYGGNDKKIMSLESVIIGNDIYLDITGVIDAIEKIASIAGVSEAELEETKDMINTLVDNKKYIQINLDAMTSLFGAVVPMPPSDDMDMDTAAIKKAFEDAVNTITSDKNVISGLEKAFEDIKIMTASDNSFTIKVTENEFVDIIGAFAKVIDENNIVIGNAVVDFLADVMKATGATEDEMPSDADKKELVDEFGELYDNWEKEKDSFNNSFDDTGFKVEFKLNIDEKNDSFFDASFNVSIFEKPDADNKFDVNTSFSIKASSEKVDDISASECIALETLYAKIMSIYESEIEFDNDPTYEDYYDDYEDELVIYDETESGF